MIIMISIYQTIHEKYFKEFIYSIEYFKTRYKSKNDYLIHLQTNTIGLNPRNINIIFNTEQMSIDKWKNMIVELSYHNSIIDYSNENLQIILSKNTMANCCLFPILFDKEKMSFNYDLENCEYDIVFLGCLTERRLNIINKLISKGIKVLIIKDKYDIQEKYLDIFKAKILLNIHAFDDYKIFEYARCSIPIYNSQIVISEKSIDSEESAGELNKFILSKVHFVDYNDIENKIVDVLSNINNYRYKIDEEELIKLTELEINRISKFFDSF